MLRGYLPAAAADADAAALIWIIPIPNPPTAPASRPSRSSTGIVSKSDFFFTVFPHSEVLSRLILAFPLPLPIGQTGYKLLK